MQLCDTEMLISGSFNVKLNVSRDDNMVYSLFI